MTDLAPTGRTPHVVRLGVLGLGAVAQAVHLPLLDRLSEQFEIAALADLSAALSGTLGERYRVVEARRHHSLDALLDGGPLDAVMILTSGSHGAAVLAGLDRNLPVFSEKPLAYTLAEADAIAERLDADPRRRLQVGYMKLYDPAVRRALAVAYDGSLGRPRSIEVTVLHPSSERQLAHAHLQPPPHDVDPGVLAALDEANGMLQRTALGPGAASSIGPLYAKVLLGSIVHELSLVRAFSGDPVGIDNVDVWPEHRWPPSVGISGRLPEDGRLSIRWHFLPDYADYREEVRIVYESSTIELAFPAPYLLNRPTVLRIVRLDDQGPGTQDRHDSVWTSTVEAFEEELLAFHALVVDGRQPAAGLAEGRADIVTCQRIAASYAARLGVPIGGEAAA